TGLRAAKFIHGDFFEYLKNCTENFDLVFCCGVLYHMSDPIALINSITKSTKRCFVWTHYYDRKNYPGPRREARSDPRYPGVIMHAVEYDNVDSGQFWGGNRPTSVWLDRDAIIAAFHRAGFRKIDVIDENLDHPNGACLSFAASDL